MRTIRTATPWTVGEYDATQEFRNVERHVAICVKETMALVAVTGPANDDLSMNDAHRIVACVNACEGINPEAVPMMVEALRFMVAHIGQPRALETREGFARAEEALAKAAT